MTLEPMTAPLCGTLEEAYRTLTSDRGKTVRTCLSDRDAIASLTPLTSDFAQELYRKHHTVGLTFNQMVWAHALAMAALHPELNPTPPELDLSKIVELFDAVRQKLKRPKIRLGLPDHAVLTLTIASSRSRNAGQIYVAGDANAYYGRIDGRGVFHPTNQSTPEVVDLLRRFASDPEKIADEFGKATTYCCFCSLPLSDSRSLNVGYGKICASNWGLAWG